jgi:hypothetical protein
LLQEEAKVARRRDYKWSDNSFCSRSTTGVVPLPLPPPPKSNKSSGVVMPVPNRCVVDADKAVQSEDKLATLRAYRHARGLCQLCFEKWARGHKCAQTVQLQILQELWELLQVDQEIVPVGECSEFEYQVHMLLSKEAVAMGGTSRTLKFLGSIQGHEVVIFIDSGSSNSFINDKLALLLMDIS